MVEFTPEQLQRLGPEDARNVSFFLSSATGQPDEARMIARLRRDDDIALELAYAPDQEIEAYVCFARLDAPRGWWLLALISVSARCRGKGYGREILRHGLECARRDRAAAVAVMGDIDFFGPMGFSTMAAEGLHSPMGPGKMLMYPIAPDTAGVKEMMVLPKSFSDF